LNYIFIIYKYFFFLVIFGTINAIKLALFINGLLIAQRWNVNSVINHVILVMDQLVKIVLHAKKIYFYNKVKKLV
jgi:hypothetical protein